MTTVDGNPSKILVQGLLSDRVVKVNVGFSPSHTISYAIRKVADELVLHVNDYLDLDPPLTIEDLRVKCFPSESNVQWPQADSEEPLSSLISEQNRSSISRQPALVVCFSPLKRKLHFISDQLEERIFQEEETDSLLQKATRELKELTEKGALLEEEIQQLRHERAVEHTEGTSSAVMEPGAETSASVGPVTKTKKKRRRKKTKQEVVGEPPNPEPEMDDQHMDPIKAMLEEMLQAERAKLQESIKAELQEFIKAERAELQESIKTERAALQESIKAERAVLQESIKAERAVLQESIKAERAVLQESIKAERAELQESIKAERAELQACVETTVGKQELLGNLMKSEWAERLRLQELLDAEREERINQFDDVVGRTETIENWVVSQDTLLLDRIRLRIACDKMFSYSNF